MITKQRMLQGVLVALAVLGLGAPGVDAQGTQRTAAPAAQRAGNITALLPTANVVRGTGRAAVSQVASRGYELRWNDLVKTEKGGRARVTMADQSILSVGSQAELRIVRHDARTQQTSLQLAYGRVRAEVAAVTRPGGRFELRTPTAVAGVIGTHFGVDSSLPGESTFVCLEGSVEIANIDPEVPGTVLCEAGMTTTVAAGEAPTPPQPATPQQIQEMLELTEPSLIVALSPAAGLAGTEVDATASGADVLGVNAVSVTGAGVVANLTGPSTASSIPVNLAIAADSAEGPRILTFTRPDGPDMAAILHVVGMPTGTDKSAYLEAIEKLLAGYLSQLEAKESSLQQAIDQNVQTLGELNNVSGQPANMSEVEQDLGRTYDVFKPMADAAGQTVTDSKEQILADFEQEFDLALNGLKERAGSDEPAMDEQFEQEVETAFAKAAARLAENTKALEENLDSQLASAHGELEQLVQKWEGFITEQARLAGVLPTPVLSPAERFVQLGEETTFDAGRSHGAGGASVVSYQWTLCSSNYRPAQYGVPLPPTDQACPALPGFNATSPEFAVNTCTLEPADYAARVTITDSENRTAKMDARLSVASPGYDDPQQVLQALADAYMTLQPTRFLGYFDELAFSGFTALQENVRNTFQILNSMSINLRLSQATINCNEANLRADWEQSYTFDANPSAVFEQSAQLTVRMQRQPGRGWFITDFQGDSGTVQGAVPGLISDDIALPELEVFEVFVGSNFGGLTAPTLALGGGGAAGVVGIGFGPTNFSALIRNISDVEFVQPVDIRFTLQVPGLAPQSVDVALPVPLPPGEIAQVTALLNVPEVTPGTEVSLEVVANPGCIVPEDNCGVRPPTTLALTLGLANYVATDILANGRAPVTGANAMQVGETIVITVPVTNVGLASPVGTLTVTVNCDAPDCIEVSTTIPAPAAGLTEVATFPLGVLDEIVGAFTATATVTTDIEEESTADNTITVPFEVVDFELEFVAPSPILPEQNIPLETPQGEIVVRLVQTGTATPFPLTVSGGCDFSCSGSNPGPLSPGVPAVIFIENSGGPRAATAHANATNHGVTRQIVQPVRFFDAIVENITAPLNSSSDPLRAQREVVSELDLRLVSDYNTDHGPAVVSVLPVAGFTLQLSQTNINPNDIFTLSIEPSLSTLNLVTEVLLQVQIPGTNPPVTIEHTIFVLPSGTADLTVTSLTAPRDLVASPWLLGEALTFQVAVENVGNGATPGGERVTLHVGGFVVGSATMPALAPGASTVLNIKGIPGTEVTGSFLQAEVSVSRAGDANIFNNSAFVFVALTDWELELEVEGGDEFNPLFITPGGSAGTSVTVVNKITRAPLSGAFSLVQGVTSTFISLSIATPGAPASNITVLASGDAVDGEYIAQVIARLSDGAVITLQRQATIHVRVGSGTPADTVIITSSANNDVSTNPLQLNGPLAEEVLITADRSSCTPGDCPGTMDLQFTDAPNVLAQPSQIKGAAYQAPNPVRFRGYLASSGQMLTGNGTVVVSGSAIQVAALVSPDPGGTQLQNLFFRVGDLFAGLPECSDLPPGGGNTASVTWIPTDGFNAASLQWIWTALPAGVTVTPSSGSTAFSGGSYPGTAFTFTNTNLSEGDQLAEIFLSVTISNAQGSATKIFPMHLVLTSQTNCNNVFSDLRLGEDSRGAWVQGGMSSLSLGSSGKITSLKLPPSGLPDLQVSSSDVLSSPSVPRAGDVVDVRFRVRNLGDADAVDVPIALRVDGVLVASDTFDVRAGSATLAGLQWTSAQSATFLGVRSVEGRSRFELQQEELASGAMRVEVVIDPHGTVPQKSSAGKVAALSNFQLRGEGSGGGSSLGARPERVLLELDDGSCVGFRFTAGMGTNCTSADVEMTVVDLGQGRYTIASHRGVADLGRIGLGSSMPDAALLQHSSEALLVAGHTYAVQLPGGRTAIFTVQAIHSPMQLQVRARQIFGRGAGAMPSMGEGSLGPVEVGDVAGTSGRAHAATVYLDIVYRAQ